MPKSLPEVLSNLIINVLLPKTKEYGLELSDFPVEFTADFARKIHEGTTSFHQAKEKIDFLLWVKSGKWREDVLASRA